MSYQSTANSYAFLMGSARLAVPSSSGGFVHLGAARGVKITEAWDPYDIETDNTPLVMKGIKNQTITVEGNLLEVNFQKLARMRGGIDAFSTTTFTFTSGGYVAVTPQTFYLTHIAPSSSETISIDIFYAAVTDPMMIPFPRDDGTDVAEIPFKLKGTCQSTRTNGAQLYQIVDTRLYVYDQYSTVAR